MSKQRGTIRDPWRTSTTTPYRVKTLEGLTLAESAEQVSRGTDNVAIRLSRSESQPGRPSTLGRVKIGR